MIRLILTPVILTFTTIAWCQDIITGTVFSKEDGSPLPGVNVVIKGTQNGTTTTGDGTFSLTIADPGSVLVFSFIGYVTREYPLNGQTTVSLTMKLDCIRDYFDVQRIGIYAVSGIIHTPIGGQLELAFPAYFGKGTLTAGIGYQSDFDSNEFLNAQAELKHFIWTCNFDMDAGWYYRRVKFGDDFNSGVHSFETNMDFGRLKFITGYSHLSLNNLETTDKQSLSGLVIGIGSWIGGPLRLSWFTKAALYKDDIEYMGQLRRDSRHVNIFARFYKLNSFMELTLGIGMEIGYRFKKQRM